MRIPSHQDSWLLRIFGRSQPWQKILSRPFVTQALLATLTGSLFTATFPRPLVTTTVASEVVPANQSSAFEPSVVT